MHNYPCTGTIYLPARRCCVVTPQVFLAVANPTDGRPPAQQTVRPDGRARPFAHIAWLLGRQNCVCFFKWLAACCACSRSSCSPAQRRPQYQNSVPMASLAPALGTRGVRLTLEALERGRRDKQLLGRYTLHPGDGAVAPEGCEGKRSVAVLRRWAGWQRQVRSRRNATKRKSVHTSHITACTQPKCHSQLAALSVANAAEAEGV